MVDEAVAFLTIKEQGQLLRERQISPVELVELYLDRIQRFDPQLNSYITVCGDAALAVARHAETEISGGQYRGALHGIPIAVKDQMYINGVRTTGGSKVFADFVPDEDATVIANIKAAGGILLGTLNTMEFHMGGTINFPYGTPRNPWNTELTPGGSSSGPGAAVAAGLCSGALGGDTGGSVRGPASLCGINGLRQTWSRVSRCGVIALCWSMDCVGPMARSAEDCALMLQYMAGYDSKDPTTSAEPVPDYTASLGGDLRGIRVGIVEEMVDEDVEDETRHIVERAAAVLGELGATVGRVSMPLMKHAQMIHSTVVDSEASSYHRERLLTRYEDYDYNTRVRLMVGALVPAGMQALAARGRAAVGQEVIDTLGSFDILVGATSKGGAPKIQTETGIHSKDDALDALFGPGRAGGNTTAYSMAGVPAISIPCGFNSQGLPLGLHLAGRHFEEGLVFKVAHAYQQVTDWHQKRPPVS